jgi:hypothetical protein
MESEILLSMNFDLGVVTSSIFLEKFGVLAGLDEKTMMLCRYLIELTLLDSKFLKFAPSNIAASAIYLTNNLLN